MHIVTLHKTMPHMYEICIFFLFVSGGLREGAEELLHQARRPSLAGKSGGCVHEAEAQARMGKEVIH